MDLNASEIGARLKGGVGTAGLCGTYEDGLKFIQEGRLSEDHSVAMEHVGRDASPGSAISSRDGIERTNASPRPTEARSHPPLHVLFIGSSLGNLMRSEDAAFLKALPLRPGGSGDTLLLGMDHGTDARRIEAAYDDSKGISRKFVMNGLTSAGRALGDERLFDESRWEYVGTYNGELRGCAGAIARAGCKDA